MAKRVRTPRTGPTPPTLAEGTGEKAVRFQLEIQDGVITRSQLLDLGLTPPDIARCVRRRDLVRVAPGIFVDHTGPLAWQQRAWVAVMRCWPAALARESVWAETNPIHVAIAAGRNIAVPTGVKVHQTRQFDPRVNWNRSPPRMEVEHAALDVAAAAATDLAAVAALVGRVQARQTSATLLAAALAQRQRTRRGVWMRRVLDDIAKGTNSVLEWEYLNKVERPHGLPAGARQVRTRAGGVTVERDVLYDEFGLIVELDGKSHHEGARDRDRDMERDLVAAVTSSARTIRLGWGQVADRPCRTASQVAVMLARGGWTGNLRRCPQCDHA